jgi:tRNA G18 (ribose-2'-O)-methylase SpoU
VATSCDLLVSVPMAGRVESLSVAAAAAVVLYAGRPSRLGT